MRYFYVEKWVCEGLSDTSIVSRFIEYKFYGTGGDLLLKYTKYDDSTNDLQHLLSPIIHKIDLSEEFLIPIVEEIISESKFNHLGRSELFQYDEFNTKYKRRIRSDKLKELGI